MEREYLVDGLIVIAVLLVLLIGFLGLFPEVRDQVKDFSADILGLGFAKTPEDVKASLKFVIDSLDMCSASATNGCVCGIELDVAPGDYKLVVDNSGSSSKFILLDSSDYVLSTLDLGGRKLGVTLSGAGNPYAYCDFNNFFMSYDSGWLYSAAKLSKADVPLVSSDGVSLYPVIKLEDGNFCLVSSELLDYEVSKGEGAGSIESLVRVGESAKDYAVGIVKIGELPVVEGVLSDYYSGKGFFDKLTDCKVIGSK